MPNTYPSFGYSALQVYPASGLSFPWAEYQPDPVHGSSSHTFGSDGVTVVMRMLIYWEDIATACQELLGYSWRDDSKLTSKGTPYLRRVLPWQHPVWNQLYVKRISEARGIRHQGKEFNLLDEIEPISPGAGETPNLGPYTNYELVELTLHFWRPPYYVRSDEAILDPDTGDPREWLRYVSKHWEMSLNMLSRENTTFRWMPGGKPNSNPLNAPMFTGSVGQTVTHYRVSRTWYQIPEQALFSSIAGGTPDGLPTNMVLTRTETENPLSLFFAACGSTQTTYQTTTTVGTTITTTTITTTIPATTTPTPSALDVTGYVYSSGKPIGGCVNAPIGGIAVDVNGNWVDNTTASRFFGCRAGTLRFDGVTFEPQPLQLPPSLMDIPKLGAVEAIAQQQYNVTFHFDLFEPPPGREYGTPICGHNLFPYSGNGLWYPIISQRDANDATTGPRLTPFHYADFTDLFYIL